MVAVLTRSVLYTFRIAKIDNIKQKNSNSNVPACFYSPVKIEVTFSTPDAATHRSPPESMQTDCFDVVSYLNESKGTVCASDHYVTISVDDGPVILTETR